jgi:nucleotide-binding universal stress UspA family protein
LIYVKTIYQGGTDGWFRVWIEQPLRNIKPVLKARMQTPTTHNDQNRVGHGELSPVRRLTRKNDPHWRWPVKILLPVDGSDCALDAVRYALHLQREGLRASFVLAVVQEPTYAFEMMLPPNAEVLDRITGAEGARALKGAEALFEAAGLPVEREIGSGDPAPTLLEIAQHVGCQAIIMGARGRGALSSALFGSVSQAVLQASMVPITIVKHDNGQSGRRVQTNQDN